MKYTFSVLFLFTIVFSVFSQVSDENGESQFMNSILMSREQSYVTVLGGLGNIKPLISEAAVVPYYMIHLNQSRWGIDLSPKIVMRMFRERSAPIRTPSYIPRATLYFNTSRLESKTLSPLFVFISWRHHSNGQDGNFYMPDSTTINTQDGDFSTNMIEIGAFITEFKNAKTFNHFFHKLSFEYHFHQKPELAGKYGNFRINNELNSVLFLDRIPGASRFLKKQLVSVSALLKVQLILGNMINASALDMKRLTTSLRISVHPSILDDFTLFAEYYYGQDYYNINFAKTLNILRFGIVADLSVNAINKFQTRIKPIAD